MGLSKRCYYEVLGVKRTASVQRAPQSICCNSTLLLGHTLGIKLQPEMRGNTSVKVLFRPENFISCNRMRDAFDLLLAAFPATHLILQMRVKNTGPVRLDFEATHESANRDGPPSLASRSRSRSAHSERM